MEAASAALLILTMVLCTAWMVHWFRPHRYPSAVGLTYLLVLARYGAPAIWYAETNPSLSIPVPETLPFFIIATLACFVLGATAASAMLRAHLPTAQQRFFAQPMDARDSPNIPLFAMVVVATAIIGVFFISASERTGIEVMVTHARDARVIRQFRQDFGATNPYSYAGFMVSQVIGPFITMVAITMWRVRRSRTWAAVAVAMAALLVVGSTMSLSKAPIIVLLLYVLVNGFVARWRGQRVRALDVALPAAGTLLLGTLGYSLTYGTETVDAALDTLERIFVIPLVSVQGFLHVYPDLVDFQNGLGIGLIASIFGVKGYVSPPLVVGAAIAGSGVCADSIWSVDLWANFGWLGVTVGSAAVGAILLSLDVWCMSRKRTAATVAVYSFLLVSTARLSEGSIFTMLLSGGLLIVPLLGWLIEGADRDAPTFNNSQPRSSDPSRSSTDSRRSAEWGA